MRLLLLVTCLEGGGAQRVVFHLATGLGPGFEARVVALRDPSGGTNRYGPLLQASGVSVGEVRLRHALDLPGMLRLAREVRAFRPDVLHAHLFHSHVAARTLGRLAGARRVVSTHHEVERRHRPLRPLLQRVGWDDASVAVSEAVAAHVRRTFGARPVVIPNGIDLERFRRGDRAQARRALGLPDGAEIVGAVGRLHPQKGLPDLLRAFAALDRAEALLVLAGEGEEEAALRRLARDLGVLERVRFLGFVEDVPRVLAALDVMAMPSRWEGFGLGLAEALACGVPVVASAVDSLPEVAGEAAVLVPPGAPERLAEALARLLGDPARRAALAREGPARAAGFGLERMLQAHRELYGRVLR